MIIQLVKFETELQEEEVLAKAEERIETFRGLSGLIQKYYVKFSEPNHYGGVYVWDSMESLSQFRESDLAGSIAQAYKVKGKPTVEILDVFIRMRE